MVRAGMLVLLAGQLNLAQRDLGLILLIILVLLVFGGRRRRSRYVPVKSKRLAQAKLYQQHYSDAKTATKPLRVRDYEYDHKHPFSRGGSSDPENIQLIKRKENRRKGNKLWW